MELKKKLKKIKTDNFFLLFFRGYNSDMDSSSGRGRGGPLRGRGPSRGRGGPGGRHSGEPRFNSGNPPNIPDYFNNIDKKGPPSGRGRGGTSNGRKGRGSGRGKGGGLDPK